MSHRNTEKSFWALVQKGKPEECWPWKRGTDEWGYGHMWMAGSIQGSHRLAYQFGNGPIPEGLCVRHECDRPSCCNPRHLILGTHRQNIQDRQDRCRQARGEKNGRAKLNQDTIRAFRSRLTGKRGDIPRLAREFSINLGVARDIASRKTWRHVLPLESEVAQ